MIESGKALKRVFSIPSIPCASSALRMSFWGSDISGIHSKVSTLWRSAMRASFGFQVRVVFSHQSGNRERLLSGARRSCNQFIYVDNIPGRCRRGKNCDLQP